MGTKKKRRLAIIAGSAIAVAAAGGGTYAFRQHQLNAKILAYRAEGMDAFKHHDYARALMPLSKYNERRQTDVETLLAFGTARSKVEAPNNRHVLESIQYFRRALELQPNNMQAKHDLLDLYSKAQYYGEAISLANELLKGDPKDAAALRAKATGLTARKQYADALDASMKLNDVDPSDIEGQGLTLYLMSPTGLNRPSDEILGRARKYLDQHKGKPDEARFMLLQGYAYHCVLDDRHAEECYKAAAKNPPKDDVKFVQMCTNLMDGIGRYDLSNQLLESVAAEGNEPQMVRMLVQRLWQNGAYDRIVRRLKGLDANSTSTDAHLLAYKAFSLYEMPQGKDDKDGAQARARRAEASAIVAALSARKEDDVALAWGKALTARFETPNANPREQIQQYQAALVRDPGNSAVRYMVGEAYARLGETELALQSWAQVVREVPSWPTPRVQMAQLLAATGRTQTAVEQAAQAYAQAQNLGSATGLVVALAAQLDSPGAQQPNVAKVLELTEEIQKKFPGEPQTFPIYVSLLSRTGDKAKAVDAVRTAIKEGYPIGTDGWLRLAAISRQQGLGLEQDVIRQAQAKEGATPKIALASAVLMEESGKAQDGLKSLIDAAAKAPADQQAAWQLAVAQFREHIKDPKARQTWTQVGDQFATDLAVQGTIVDLPDDSSIWQDRPFIERTIQRLKALTGEQGYHWQLARGKWLLSSPNKQRDSAEAVVTLSDIVRGSPGLVAPRVYLARAMLNVGNTAAAIEQLRAASDINPENATIALDLAQMYQADGRFNEAKPFLDRAARSANDPASKQRLATYLWRQGDVDAAVRALGNDVDGAKADLATAVLAADLYRRHGDFDRAGKLYEKIAARPDADESAIAEASDFFATHDRMDAARSTLARLDQMKLAAGHRQAILAAFEEKHGKMEIAEDLYRQAVDAAPADATVRREQVMFHIRHDRFEQAAADCDAGLAKAPGNADLASLKNQALALKAAGTGGSGADVAALVAELSKDPQNVANVESLRTFNDVRNEHDPAKRVARMRQVADKYPRFLPVQVQVARMYLDVRRPADAAAKARQEAVDVARRAMDNFPNDPEPARVLTQVYASCGLWNEAAMAAQDWRKRSIENPEQADVALAGFMIELDHPADAAKTIEPYLGRAKADPDAHNAVFGVYARALIADGRETEALATIKPYLSRSEEWRMSALRLAKTIHGPADHTAAWIDQIAAAAPSDSLKGQYEVANAWYMSAMGLKDGDANRAQFLKKAKDAITPLTRRPDTTATVWLMAASVNDNLGDRTSAIEAYRRALQFTPKLDPDQQALAQNNLAYLLMASDSASDLDEARQLAERAVAASPGDAGYCDTLARVYQRIGKRDSAIAAFQQVLNIEPQNVQAMVPTIQLLHDAGQREAAKAMFGKLESILQTDPSLRTPDIDVEKLRKQL